MDAPDYDNKKPVILMYATEKKNWTDSSESIQKQKITKLTKSDSSMKFDQVDLVLLKSNPNKRGKIAAVTTLGPNKPKELTDEDILRVPPKNSNSGELAVLRVTLSRPQSRILLTEILPPYTKKKHHTGIGIIDVIEGSEDAVKDSYPWRYLRRRVVDDERRQKCSLFKSKPYHCSGKLSRRRTSLTCPNCTFAIKTVIKHVNSVRTVRSAWAMAPLGLCGLPYVLILFKDVVHTCPFCNLYLGFCPAFSYKKAIKRKFSTK